jgi:hypothetical protein
MFFFYHRRQTRGYHYCGKDGISRPQKMSEKNGQHTVRTSLNSKQNCDLVSLLTTFTGDVNI